MYQISYITVDSKENKTTVVHKSSFNIRTLIPENTALIKASFTSMDFKIKPKIYKFIDTVFINRQCEYLIFNDYLNTDDVTKYLMVYAEQFKPTNKFEEFLEQHNLLFNSLMGIKLMLTHVTVEYSREYGEREFKHNGEELVTLKDSGRVNEWFKGKSNYHTGEVYRSSTTTKLVSINGILVSGHT